MKLVSFALFICFSASSHASVDSLINAYAGEWGSIQLDEGNPKVNIKICPVTVEVSGVNKASKGLLFTTQVNMGNREFSSTLVGTVKQGQGAHDVELQTYDIESPVGVECEQHLPEKRKVHAARHRCTMYFYEKASHWYAKTPLQGCESNFRGAVKMVAEDWLFPNKLMTWERWYDATGTQVAGAESGPIVFKKAVNQGE